MTSSLSSSDGSASTGLEASSVAAPARLTDARLWSALKGGMHRAVDLVDVAMVRASPYRRGIVLSTHVVFICLANYLAFVLRFDGAVPSEFIGLFLQVLPLVLIARIAAFAPLRLFEGLWRYVGVKDLRNVVIAVTSSSLGLFVLVHYILGIKAYPRAVFVIDWLLLIFFLSAVRGLKRVLHGMNRQGSTEKRVVIVGAGDGGEMLLSAIERQPWYGYHAIGCVDDDPAKKGTRIRGVPVLGTRQDLDWIVEKYGPTELLIAIPSASRLELRGVIMDCRRHGLPVKALPGLRDILCSGGLLDSIQNLEPEGLLSRAPVSFPFGEMRAAYRGQSILVTGAGGSIGSELARQLADLEPGRLVLLERHEGSLFHLENGLRRSFPDVEIVPVIGDVLDSVRLGQVLTRHRPKVIFHAAAYKHVPMMEHNPHEAIKVNVLGTQKLAQSAMQHGVERFVFISTDKAVRPVNVMGKTKRIAELMLQMQNAESGSTRFMTVRFGNVLESSGSVVPVFKEQILRGGPVTVTDAEATRYFMTASEAVQLVLNAALLGSGGEIFVLDMGKPIRVLDLAERLIKLYGYEPGRDIQIDIIGLRPGERLHEDLFNPNEKVRKTKHPRIRVAVADSDRPAERILTQIPILEHDAFNGLGVTELDERLTSAIEMACAKN